MFNIKEKNVEVFADTKRLCENNNCLINAILKSRNSQYIVQESETFQAAKEQRFKEPVTIVVSQKRSLEAAKQYASQKVCVHNFASATNPGGGVLKGSSAQEEAICRCSTLYFNISESSIVSRYHDLHKKMLIDGTMDVTYNDDCIYTPEVVVFKSDIGIPKVLRECDWYNVDIITCAAPNLRNDPSNDMNPNSGVKKVKFTDEELRNLHIKRMRRILDIAKAEKEDVVILGAFGCGAFYNPPHVVAEAMKIVVKEYQYDFKTIEFAVFCTPKDMKNYEVFKKMFQK